MLDFFVTIWKAKRVLVKQRVYRDIKIRNHDEAEDNVD